MVHISVQIAEGTESKAGSKVFYPSYHRQCEKWMPLTAESTTSMKKAVNLRRRYHCITTMYSMAKKTVPMTPMK
jgi:hypothetical protein